MIDLLYSTGIRVGELVNLNISDIDLHVIFDNSDFIVKYKNEYYVNEEKMLELTSR